jgi:type IV pilus assembly protein PilA
MLTRIRKSMEEKDQGFTLIELLVVMIIIGILAAIAIPVFLNQRKKAVDSSIKSDIRTIASQMETYYTDSQSYWLPANTTAGDVTVGTDAVKVSSGNYFNFRVLTTATAPVTGAATGVVASAGGYCIQGLNAKGSNTASGLYYNSLAGGFTTTPCP